MSKSYQTKLDAIEQRQKELDAERARLVSLKTEQDRKNDTRRKILAGAIVLGDESLKKVVTSKLSGTLTADRDRKLFGLAPLPKKVAAATTGAPATAQRSGDQSGGGQA